MKKSQLKKIIKEEIVELKEVFRHPKDVLRHNLKEQINGKIKIHQSHSKEAHRAGYDTKVYGYTGGEHDAIVETLEWVLKLL